MTEAEKFDELFVADVQDYSYQPLKMKKRELPTKTQTFDMNAIQVEDKGMMSLL